MLHLMPLIFHNFPIKSPSCLLMFNPHYAPDWSA